jgi:ribonuclease HII
MPWIIGIDEAGYGPNLGPFVMSAVACRVPEQLAAADLWDVLRAAVRRPGDSRDERLLVADSKQVYSSARGLRALETGVLAALPLAPNATTLAHRLEGLALAPAELAAEPWYTGTTTVPLEADPATAATAAARLARAGHENGVSVARIRSTVVCPARFNAITDRAGSKGAVLGQGLVELLHDLRESLGKDEPASFFIDKHGGRNTYAPLLQQAIRDGLVVARRESAAQSVYSVLGSRHPVQFTFQPRADSEQFCVALASMVSKYLRELLMLEFNRFWQAQIPGLKPTAGYPGDAARFLEAIRPAFARLKLSEDVVWRRK